MKFCKLRTSLLPVLHTFALSVLLLSTSCTRNRYQLLDNQLADLLQTSPSSLNRVAAIRSCFFRLDPDLQRLAVEAYRSANQGEARVFFNENFPNINSPLVIDDVLQLVGDHSATNLIPILFRRWAAFSGLAAADPGPLPSLRVLRIAGALPTDEGRFKPLVRGFSTGLCAAGGRTLAGKVHSFYSDVTPAHPLLVIETVSLSSLAERLNGYSWWQTLDQQGYLAELDYFTLVRRVRELGSRTSSALRMVGVSNPQETLLSRRTALLLYRLRPVNGKATSGILPLHTPDKAVDTTNQAAVDDSTSHETATYAPVVAIETGAAAQGFAKALLTLTSTAGNGLVTPVKVKGGTCYRVTSRHGGAATYLFAAQGTLVASDSLSAISDCVAAGKDKLPSLAHDGDWLSSRQEPPPGGICALVFCGDALAELFPDRAAERARYQQALVKITRANKDQLPALCLPYFNETDRKSLEAALAAPGQRAATPSKLLARAMPASSLALLSLRGMGVPVLTQLLAARPGVVERLLSRTTAAGETLATPRDFATLNDEAVLVLDQLELGGTTMFPACSGALVAPGGELSSVASRVLEYLATGGVNSPTVVRDGSAGPDVTRITVPGLPRWSCCTTADGRTLFGATTAVQSTVETLHGNRLCAADDSDLDESEVFLRVNIASLTTTLIEMSDQYGTFPEDASRRSARERLVRLGQIISARFPAVELGLSRSEGELTGSALF